MKFIVSSAVLQRQLSAINGVINNNPLIPILENFLFKLEDGVLIVTASDGNVSMTTQLNVESTNKGNVAVPAKILLDTLKSLPEQPVTFNISEESNSIELTSHSGRYKLAGESADDFPKIPTPEKSKSKLIFSSDVLGKALSNTLFAVSTDDLRPAMTGIFLDLKEKSAVFVATDGHRLIKYQREDIQVGNDSLANYIIPKKALGLLKAVLPTELVEVTTEFTSNHAFFSFDNIQLVTRLIDETFPDYENAIPLNNASVLTIDRAEFVNSLKRLIIYANKTTNQVRLKLSPTNLQIFAEDLDFSNEANETLMAEYDGEEMEIGFNAKFLTEMLNTLISKDILFSFSTPSKAGLIRPKETAPDENILMLVMPVMLNSYA